MADLTTPIDIQQIQDTADKKQPKINKLMMDNIRELFANLTKYPGNVRSKVSLLTFEDDSIMQPYDPDLSTAKKLGVIDKRDLSVDIGMSYIKDEVERYRDTYLGTLEDLNLGPAELPFAQWYLETITQVGLQDMAILPFQGEKAAGTDPEDITDGYLHIIADEVTAGNIAAGEGNLYAVTGGAYTAANIGDELKAQWNKLPSRRQNKGVNIYAPWSLRSLYQEWLKSEYANITDGNVSIQHLDGTYGKAKFVWTPEMGTSNRVIMTPKDNLVYGVDRDNKEFGKIHVFKPNNNPYYIAATNKVVIGFQIRTLNSREFVVNNLA